MQKKSFYLYIDMLDVLEDLTDHDVANLFRAIHAYHTHRDFELHPHLKAVFRLFKNQFERDAEKYAKRCEKNRENIKKRWEKDTNEYDRIRTDTKHTDKDKDKDKDKDIYINNTRGKAEASPVPYQSIIDLYHENLPNNPKIARLSEARKRQIKARWNNGIGDLDAWGRYFQLVADSKFLTGQCPPGHQRSRPFIADIDFLIKESNVLKIVEGKYE